MNGPHSVRRAESPEHPGPPVSHTSTGSVDGLFCDSTNLKNKFQLIIVFIVYPNKCSGFYNVPVVQLVVLFCAYGVVSRVLFEVGGWLARKVGNECRMCTAKVIVTYFPGHMSQKTYLKAASNNRVVDRSIVSTEEDALLITRLITGDINDDYTKRGQPAKRACFSLVTQPSNRLIHIINYP